MRKFCLFGLLLLFFIEAGFAYAKSKRIPARTGHSAVYDLTNKQMIIFGGAGQAGPCLSDTWAFDIEQKDWKEIASVFEESPTARAFHTTIYDSAKKQMIIFGGGVPEGNLSDTWIFDIEKKMWKEIETEDAPPATRWHSAIYDLANKQMIVLCNAMGSAFSEIWTLDIEKNKWKDIITEETITSRYGHSAVYDSANKKMIVFGGNGRQGDLSDTWTFDIENKKWEIIKTESEPLARNWHSAVYDAANKQMIIFGGSGYIKEVRQRKCLSDTWVLDIEKNKWTKIHSAGKTPPARKNHSAIYDSTNKQMIIFGGAGQAGQYLSDTWAFDIENKKWKNIKTK